MTRRTRTVALALLFAAHAAITVRTLLDHSYVDLVVFPVTSWPAAQVFSDLTMSLVLVTSWLIRDARHSGRSAWPWVVATVFVGSFAPLGYLLTGAWSERSAAK